MPTNAVILANAPIACVLAGNDIQKGSLFTQRIDPLLDRKIYATYFVIKKVYDKDPSYSGMDVACIYLWELMGKYGIMAQRYTGGGGGAVSPVTPDAGSNIYPLFIYSSDFQPDGRTYINTNIVGDTLSIYPDQYSANFLLAGVDTFSYTSNGIIINIPDFDARTQDWVIRVEKIYGSSNVTYPFIFDSTFSNVFN